MIKSVYKITDKYGFFYIGSTSNPKRRLIEHKSKNKLLDSDSIVMKVISVTEDYVELEETILESVIDNKFCVNKSTGCFGPKGHKVKKSTELKSLQMKKRWQDPEQKKIILAGIEKSRMINDVFEMSKKSHELRWSKMPQWFAMCKKTKKVYGPYRGYHFAKDELKISMHAIFKTLKKGNSNRKYLMKYFDGGMSW